MTDPAVDAAQRVCAEKALLNDLPYGVNAAEAEIAVLATREALAPLRELHRPVGTRVRSAPSFESRIEKSCATCDAGFEPWPCATARLIYPSEEL